MQTKKKYKRVLFEGQPVCHRCGKTGADVEFLILSPYGFGTFCAPCERKEYEATRCRCLEGGTAPCPDCGAGC